MLSMLVSCKMCGTKVQRFWSQDWGFAICPDCEKSKAKKRYEKNYIRSPRPRGRPRFLLRPVSQRNEGGISVAPAGGNEAERAEK